MNHLMIIATIVAFIGAVGALVLVRQRDFVIPGGGGHGGPGGPGAPGGPAATPADGQSPDGKDAEPAVVAPAALG